MDPQIEGVPVEVGTILVCLGKLAKIVRLTRTQATCHYLTSDMVETEAKFRVTLDTSGRWGVNTGGLQIGTGGMFTPRFWLVAKNPAEIVAKMRQRARIAQEEQEKSIRLNQIRVTEQAQVMQSGYDKRTCLNLYLRLWKMTFQHPEIGTVAVVWSVQDPEACPLQLDVTWYFRYNDNNVRRRSTMVDGETQLMALATVHYDRF